MNSNLQKLSPQNILPFCMNGSINCQVSLWLTIIAETMAFILKVQVVLGYVDSMFNVFIKNCMIGKSMMLNNKASCRSS